MDDWLSLSPRDLAALIDKITAKAGNNPASIGLTGDLVTQLQAVSIALVTRQNAVDTTGFAYRGAQKELGTQVKASKVLLRRARKKIEASDASEQDRIAAGVPSPNDTPMPLMAPTDLVVTPSGTVNKLKWKKNGNSSGVQYVIEVKIADGNWTLLDVITATKYEHTGRTAGQRVMYRIKARKGRVTSDYSNEAGVYLS